MNKEKKKRKKQVLKFSFLGLNNLAQNGPFHTTQTIGIYF